MLELQAMPVFEDLFNQTEKYHIVLLIYLPLLFVL